MKIARRLAALAPLLVAAFAPDAAAEGRLDRVRAEAAELRLARRAELAAFADRADDLGLPDLAADLRAESGPPDPAVISVTPPPRAVRGELPTEEAGPVRELRRAVRRAEDAFAEAAFTLARTAATKGSAEPGAANVAFALARDALAANPDHPAARRALGQVRDGEEWVTPWEQGQARRGNVDHPVFGWVRERDVERLDAGERPLAGRWVTPEREALVRQDFRRGWLCETEHYRVRTNYSWEEGAAVARNLERFHTFFRAVFPGFGLSAGDLIRRFGTSGPVPAYRNAGGRGGKYEVHLFRDKAEYVDALRQKIPQIAITNGLYFTGDRVAYFYKVGPHANPRTVFHEATHQLFYECTPRDRMVCETEHFWVMEGLGCYMESFSDDGLTMTAGEPDYRRFTNAKVRLVRDDLYEPLAELDELGRERFQNVPLPQLKRRYSQISGLTHYFMHGEGGTLRPALSAHLEALYHPLVRPGQVAGLNRVLGRAWETLDAQYAAYIAAL